jgi:hypothetical protein
LDDQQTGEFQPWYRRRRRWERGCGR